LLTVDIHGNNILLTTDKQVATLIYSCRIKTIILSRASVLHLKQKSARHRQSSNGSATVGNYSSLRKTSSYIVWLKTMREYIHGKRHDDLDNINYK